MPVRADAGVSGEARRSFGSAAAFTFGTQLGVALLSFASLVVVSRSLGPRGRGELAFLTASAVLASMLASFGVEEATMNVAGRSPAARRALATNAVLLAGCLGGGAAALLHLGAQAAPGLVDVGDSRLVVLALVAVPVLVLKLYLKFLVNADYGFGVTNLAWLLPPLVTFTVNVVLVVAGTVTVATVFTTWVAAHVFATVVLVAHILHRGQGFGRPDARVAAQCLRFGVRSHPGRVLLAGYYRLDQWLLGALAGAHELGLYAIAVSWSEVLFYVPTTLSVVQRPYLVRASTDEAGVRAARVFRSCALVTVAAMVGMLVAAPWLCTFFFGDEFAASATPLRVLTLGALGVLALQLLGSALTSQAKPGVASVASGVAFVAMVALDLVLIPSFGGTGAAVASAVASAVGGVAVAVLFAHRLGVRLGALVPEAADAAWLVAVVRRRLRPPGRVGTEPSL